MIRAERIFTASILCSAPPLAWMVPAPLDMPRAQPRETLVKFFPCSSVSLSSCSSCQSDKPLPWQPVVSFWETGTQGSTANVGSEQKEEGFEGFSCSAAWVAAVHHHALFFTVRKKEQQESSTRKASELKGPVYFKMQALKKAKPVLG